jgi:hypothetical protein
MSDGNEKMFFESIGKEHADSKNIYQKIDFIIKALDFINKRVKDIDNRLKRVETDVRNITFRV